VSGVSGMSFCLFCLGNRWARINGCQIRDRCRHHHAELMLGYRQDAGRRLEFGPGELQVLLLDQRLRHLSLQGVDSLLTGRNDGVRNSRSGESAHYSEDAETAEDGHLAASGPQCRAAPVHNVELGMSRPR